jgi:predicted alpha/beta superfamily hydrolase
MISRHTTILLIAFAIPLAALAQSAPVQTPDPDAFYKLGPDSLPQDGVPKGEIRGPFMLPSNAYPGTQHSYWVYVPAQYDSAVPAGLMIYNDGQAFMNPDGDMRAQNVMDNLIFRRELPVMIGVFINPGRRPGQPEPNATEWGDRTTNRPTEYNSLDDKYARVIVDELMPVLYKEYNISKDPERHGIGGSSSGAIAAFTVAWQRPNEFRKVLSNVGSFVDLRGGNAYPDLIRATEKKPIRILSLRRKKRQSWPARRGSLQRSARLVLSKRANDAGTQRERLRPELRVGDEQARTEDGRGDLARHDALAVARSPVLQRSERRGGAIVRRPEEERREAVDYLRIHAREVDKTE